MCGIEEEVAVAIKEAKVSREKLFITNKVAQGIDDIPAAIYQRLETMKLEHFDL
jgi:diketogulonate reductase-like aldo/keto reductase